MKLPPNPGFGEEGGFGGGTGISDSRGKVGGSSGEGGNSKWRGGDLD